jgi:hypothetical protein
MLIDGITLPDTAVFTNFSVESGSTFASTGNNLGELFYKTGSSAGLHVYNGVSWAPIGATLGYTPVNKAGDTLTGSLILNADPVNVLGAATKQYVDAAITGLSWKKSVRAGTTAAGTLASSFANGSVIDGVTLVTADRILIKNQATQSENGIYTVNASGAPTRAVDADISSEIDGAAVYVTTGTTNANTAWTQTTAAPTVGSSNIVFAQFTGGSSYVAGSGLSLTGNTFANTGVTSIVAGTNISISGSTGAVTINATSTSIGGGVAGSVVYQTGIGATGTTAAGTSGQVLTSNGNAAPTWATPSAGAAAAGSLTGTTLAANVVSSSLTSVGSLANLFVGSVGSGTGTITTSTITSYANGTPYTLSISGTAGGSTGGNVTLSGGTGSNNGGTIAITGGGGANGGASVSVTGGAGTSSSGAGGAIIIASGTNTSSINGVLTFKTGATQRLSILGNGAWSLGADAVSYGTTGQVFTSNGSGSAPTWQAAGAFTSATNLNGGAAGSVPYQSATGTTAMLAVGTAGQVLTLASGVPTWASPATAGAAAAGTLTGTTLASNVVNSSLTSVGTLANLFVGSVGSGTGTITTSTITSYQNGTPYTLSISGTAGGSTGGNVTLFGGTGSNNGGTVAISGGGGANGGANVTITGGAGTSSSGSGGAIIIGSGTNTSSINGVLTFKTGATQRLSILSSGAWSVGADAVSYGTAGQVLTSAGSASAPTWQNKSAVTALTSGATVTPNFDTSYNFSLTAGISFTLANPSGTITPGQHGTITITQDATGSRVISWGSNWKAAGGTKPVLSTAANAVDTISYYVISATSIVVTGYLNIS